MTRELVLDRVPDQFALVLQPHLFEQSGLMRADGLDAERQLARNARRRSALHEKLENAEFALRQPRAGRIPEFSVNGLQLSIDRRSG